jgi:hypothetical protein
MNRLLKLSALLLAVAIVFVISCQKELSCEDCASVKANKPPIAVAGSDQLITLPTDSVLLDGSSSTDADGTIVLYKWNKISGPVSGNILRADSSRTVARGLAMGVYKFELFVKDNGGLTTTDTVQVIVNDPALNQPPIAIAGADQAITLPTNAINLNGGGSTDPDNNITTYAWIKISGPLSFTIANANVAQTQVTNLDQGSYQFELKVTDAGGLSSKDTMQVIVNAIVVSTCLPLSRPVITAQLIPFGTLSEARSKIAVASAGNKIVFAGGRTAQGRPTATVDIFDITTQAWSTAQLTIPRYGIAAIAAGNTIYFAGGISPSPDTPSSRIDIYDVVSNSWSTAQLSEPRAEISAAAVGNKIMFAGGVKSLNCSICTSDRVDVFDGSTNTFTIAHLSIAREGLSATTAGNKVYFAGGHEFWNGTGVYDEIDIYDNGNNTWSTSTLAERKAHHGSIVFGNYIYWAGGEIWNNYNDYETTCSVERRDLTNGTSTVMHLFQPSFASSNAQASMQTLLKNGSIAFYTGHTQFDIYNPASNIWSIGTMSLGFDYSAVISVNNTIIIAGGGFYSYAAPSSKVWKLEF